MKFFIAGPLDPVSNLSTSVNLTAEEVLNTWTPPYSLDLTDIEPDIVYCVDIYSITCESRDHLFSNCSVVDSELIVYRTNTSQYIFEIIVTPRSNTKSARNGTSNALKGVNILILVHAMEWYYNNYIIMQTSLLS